MGTGTQAVPPVRVREFVEGDDGPSPRLRSVCSSDYTQHLEFIGKDIASNFSE